MSCKGSKYVILMWYLLIANTTFAYTHADTLRGSNGGNRDWWKVKKYNLQITFDTIDKTIQGICYINFAIIKEPSKFFQIDLQTPMIIDSSSLSEISDVPIISGDLADHKESRTKTDFEHEGNVWWIRNHFLYWHPGENKTLIIYFHGKPRSAKNPPWDGGFIWTKDSLGNPWIAVACQGLGASVWWPCKDAQWDKPDNGAEISFNYYDNLTTISNGIGHIITGDYILNTPNVWIWAVKNPINTYDVTFYIGNYAHWTDTMMGEKGKLNLDFYPLRYNEAKAREQFKVVKPMLHCFEYWMGPYPFYGDGYKLVEAPYLGMEHQSAVAYGNEYKMGYRGIDRSGTGVGLLFDFIIVHESGHEWFGNNVTAYDIADNWIHEGITTYSETLFAECQFGKEKAFEYCRGEWKNIRNDRPIIGDYGVNNEGSSDMYDKGAAIIHMIRMMTNNDEKFRGLLHAINERWYHGIVTSKELEQFMSDYTHLKLNAFFDQYLHTIQIPELEYYIKNRELYYKFNDIVNGFSLPLQVTDGDVHANIQPNSEWQHTHWEGGFNISFSKDFLIRTKS